MKFKSYIDRTFPGIKENVHDLGSFIRVVADKLGEKPDELAKQLYVKRYKRTIIRSMAYIIFWCLDYLEIFLDLASDFLNWIYDKFFDWDLWGGINEKAKNFMCLNWKLKKFEIFNYFYILINIKQLSDQK